MQQDSVNIWHIYAGRQLRYMSR